MKPAKKPRLVHGRRTIFVASDGRKQPRAEANVFLFAGLGVLYSVDTQEIGLAFGSAFMNKNRYRWRFEVQGKRWPRAELAAEVLDDFTWYDEAALHEVLRVPETLLRQRLNEQLPSTALCKPLGYERLALARSEGIEWDNRRQKISDWCAELGLSYTTLCARLANPDTTMEQAMSPERVLKGRQQSQIMTPELRIKLEQAGVTYQAYYQRIKQGWAEKDALRPVRRYYRDPQKSSKEARALLLAAMPIHTPEDLNARPPFPRFWKHDDHKFRLDEFAHLKSTPHTQRVMTVVAEHLDGREPLSVVVEPLLLAMRWFEDALQRRTYGPSLSKLAAQVDDLRCRLGGLQHQHDAQLARLGEPRQSPELEPLFNHAPGKAGKADMVAGQLDALVGRQMRLRTDDERQDFVEKLAMQMLKHCVKLETELIEADSWVDFGMNEQLVKWTEALEEERDALRATLMKFNELEKQQ